MRIHCPTRDGTDVRDLPCSIPTAHPSHFPFKFFPCLLIVAFVFNDDTRTWVSAEKIMFHFEERDTGKERNEDEGHYPENDDRRHSEPLDSRPASPSHVQRHRQGHGTLPSIGRSASMGHDLSISRSGRRSSPQPYTVITRQKASESAVSGVAYFCGISLSSICGAAASSVRSSSG